MSLLKKCRNRLLTRAAQNHMHRFCGVLPSRDRKGSGLRQPFFIKLMNAYFTELQV